MNNTKITFSTLAELINQDRELGLTPTPVDGIKQMAEMMFDEVPVELDEFQAFQVAATYDEATAKRVVRHFLANKAAWSSASISHLTAIELVNKATAQLIDEIALKHLLTARVMNADKEVSNQHRIIGELNATIAQLERNNREPQSDTAHRATPEWPTDSQICSPLKVHQLVLTEGMSRKLTFSPCFCTELRLPLVNADKETIQLFFWSGDGEITVLPHPDDTNLAHKQWTLSRKTPFLELTNEKGHWLVVSQASI